ncbi:MAG: flagellar hook assembly protein FlgD [Hyphomicrobiales bacterium]|nr:MAG: flagellar hook assembly protein FlgD [Hyphomicrobiales bacterium]
MQVTSATSTSSTSNTTTTSSNPNKDAAAASLDYSTFLNLLLAQLKNQDPTKPMDSTEYMSQLASFSNVEQTIKTNSKLDSLLTSQSLSQAENLVGKTVSNADGTITGKVVSVNVASDASVATLDNGKKLTLGSGITVSASAS